MVEPEKDEQAARAGASHATASLFDHIIWAARRAPRLPSALRWRPRDFSAALAILALIPLGTTILALLIGFTLHERDISLERRMAARLRQLHLARDALSARTQVAPLLSQPTISGLLDRLGRTLPPNAQVHMLAVDDHGVIKAQIDCNDPDILRAALRSDDMLEALFMIGQGPAEVGVRMSLSSRRP